MASSSQQEGLFFQEFEWVSVVGRSVESLPILSLHHRLHTEEKLILS